MKFKLMIWQYTLIFSFRYMYPNYKQKLNPYPKLTMEPISPKQSQDLRTKKMAANSMERQIDMSNEVPEEDKSMLQHFYIQMLEDNFGKKQKFLNLKLKIKRKNRYNWLQGKRNKKEDDSAIFNWLVLKECVRV